MARLELDLSVKGKSGVQRDLSDIANEAEKLGLRYDGLVRKISEADFASKELERDLRALNAQFKAGAISEAQFARESSEIKEALASSRQAAFTYNRELTAINATLKQVKSSQDGVVSSGKKLTAYHRDAGMIIRGSSAVTVEFTRVLQDLPYGIQGVANNLQQLSQNWAFYVRNAKEAAAANGQVLSTKTLLASAFRGLLQPTNLLVLGISAITAGWTYYQRQAQSAAKATRENTEATKQYYETLEAVRGSSLRGAQNAQQELASMQVLYRATQDTTLSLEDRRRAVDKLQKEYPAYFGNLTQEAVLTGNAKTQYDSLRDAILATAQARAYEQRIAEKSGQNLELLEKNVDLVSKLRIENKKLQEETARLGGENAVRILQEQAKEMDNVYAVSRLSQFASIQEEIARLGKEINTGAEQGEQNQRDIDRLLNAAVGLYGEQVHQTDKIKDNTGKIKEDVSDLGRYLAAGALAQEKLNELTSDLAISLLDPLQQEEAAITKKFADIAKKGKDAFGDMLIAGMGDTQALSAAQSAYDEFTRQLESSQSAAFERLKNDRIEKENQANKAVFDKRKAELDRLFTLDRGRNTSATEEMRKALTDEYNMRLENAKRLVILGKSTNEELIKIQQDYRQAVEELDTFKVLEEGFLRFADVYATAFASVITDGDNAAENIKRAFKSAINSIISDLIKLGAMRVFKAILGISTGGIGGLAGGFLGKLLGFSSGGYTGTGPQNQVAGVVHRGEYVFDADTVKRLGLGNLRSIHRGSNVSSRAISISGTQKIEVGGQFVLTGDTATAIINRAETKQGIMYGTRS